MWETFIIIRENVLNKVFLPFYFVGVISKVQADLDQTLLIQKRYELCQELAQLFVNLGIYDEAIRFFEQMLTHGDNEEKAFLHDLKAVDAKPFSEDVQKKLKNAKDTDDSTKNWNALLEPQFQSLDNAMKAVLDNMKEETPRDDNFLLAMEVAFYETINLYDDAEKKANMNVETKKNIKHTIVMLKKWKVSTNPEFKNVVMFNDYGSELQKLWNPNTVNSIDAQDDDGNTLLHIACESGDLKMIRALLDRRAVNNIKNKNGKSPSELLDEWRSNQHGTSGTTGENENYQINRVIARLGE